MLPTPGSYEVGCDGCPYIGPADGSWWWLDGNAYCSICAQRRAYGLPRPIGGSVMVEVVRCPVCELVGFDCGAHD